MKTLASVKERPAVISPTAVARRGSMWRQGRSDDDLALCMQRRRSQPSRDSFAGSVGPAAVISQDEPNKLSFRETPTASIRYEVGSDGVFFQREDVSPPHAHASSSPGPALPPELPRSAQGYTAFASDAASHLVPGGDAGSRSRSSTPATQVTDSRRPSTLGPVVTVDCLDAADAALQRVSSLWTATSHSWPDMFSAASDEMTAMWDGEDVHWLANGPLDDGAFSAVFGCAPRPTTRMRQSEGQTGQKRRQTQRPGARQQQHAQVPAGGRTPPTRGLSPPRSTSPPDHQQQQQHGVTPGSSKVTPPQGEGSPDATDDGQQRFESASDGLMLETLRYLLKGAAERDMPGHYNVGISANALLVCTDPSVSSGRRVIDLTTGVTGIPTVLGSSLGDGGKGPHAAALLRRNSKTGLSAEPSTTALINPGADNDKSGVDDGGANAAASEDAGSLRHHRRARFGEDIDEAVDDTDARTEIGGGFGSDRRNRSSGPAVVEVKPSARRYSEATSYVRNVRVAPVTSEADMKQLRNHWAMTALQYLEERENARNASFGHFGDVSFADSDAASNMDRAREATGTLLMINLTVTQVCSIAQTKVSQVRFAVVDGGGAVPNFLEVLRSLRCREPLPRALPASTHRDPIVRLLMATGSKKVRSHHVLVECFDVTDSINALEALAAARGEDVQTNIVTHSAGVRQIAEELVADRRQLRSDVRALADEAQQLREKTDSAERVMNSLSHASYGSRAAMHRSPSADEATVHETDTDDGIVESSSVTSDVDSITASVAEEFAMRHRFMDQYVEDRRGVTRKQATTLAQCQQTWREASSRGLELRKAIADMKAQMTERQHCEDKARAAREAEFAAEVARLEHDPFADFDAQHSPGGRSVGPRGSVARSKHTSSPSLSRSASLSRGHAERAGSFAGSTASLQARWHRSDKLKAKLEAMTGDAEIDAEKRQLAFNSRYRNLERIVEQQRKNLTETESETQAGSKRRATSQRTYLQTNALLFEAAVLHFRVLTFYRNRFGPHFPDFLKQDEAPGLINADDALAVNAGLQRPEAEHHHSASAFASFHLSAANAQPTPAAAEGRPLAGRITPSSRPGSAMSVRQQRPASAAAGRQPSAVSTPQARAGGVSTPKLVGRVRRSAVNGVGSGTGITSREVKFPFSSCDPCLQASVEGGTLANRTPQVVGKSFVAALELLRNQRGVSESTSSRLGDVRADVLRFPVTYVTPELSRTGSGIW